MIYFFVVGKWYVWSLRAGSLKLYGVWTSGDFSLGAKKRKPENFF